MLIDLIRRFKGLGVAIVVLAMSAGVVFAAAPTFVPVSSHANPAANAGSDKQDPTEEPTEDSTEQATEDPTEDPTAAAPLTAPTDPTDPTGAAADTHGELVSAAAQMPLPDSFAGYNRGAFVSCVAHMKDVTLSTIVWDDVNPTACGLTENMPSGHGKANGQDKAASGKANGQDKAASGKANGQAKAAEAKSKHQN